MSQSVTISLTVPNVDVEILRPDVDVSVGSVPTPLVPNGAHLGLISEATEVYDPSGILVSASDLEDGTGVRIEVNGEVALTPADGVMIAVPLRQPDGSLHPIIELINRYPLFGGYGFAELSPWSTKATPSNAAAFVGVMDCLPSGWASGYGIFGYSLNAEENKNVVSMATLLNGTWNVVLPAANADETQSGVDSAMGQGYGGLGNGYGITIMPRDGVPSLQARRLNAGVGYALRAGRRPYLVFGVFQPTAGPGGSIDIAPLAELWPARLPTARGADV